jgi:uncharacterized protein
MIDLLKQPWPWYVAGLVIGLTVPALLILGNKNLGISSSFRHICAACLPANIKFFNYDWKKEIWNFFFIGGIILGAFIAARYLSNNEPLVLSEELTTELRQYGITPTTRLLPHELFSFNSLFTRRGFCVMVIGGLLVGFGTRYAGGCTSGHAIMGLSTLQLASLIATISFMAGGFIMANLILPYILRL